MASVLVTGGSGFIGAAVAGAMRAAGHFVRVTYYEHGERAAHGGDNRRASAVDLRDSSALAQAVKACEPDVVVHLAAMSELAACERDPAMAERVNVAGTKAVVEACGAAGAVMLFASTDQVFDGERGRYGEADGAAPLHVYGRTKLAAEAEVAALGQHALSLRISLVYGVSPTRKRSASEQVLNAIAAGESPRLFVDEFRTPILVDDVAAVAVELSERLWKGDGVISGSRVLHVAGPERVSRYEIGLRMAEVFGFDRKLLKAARRDDVALGAPRPRDVSLDTSLAQRVLRTPIRGVREGLAHLAASASPH